MSKFKVGDVIKGKKNNCYLYTNEDMCKAKVLKLNGKIMIIEILEHKDKNLVGSRFTVLNSRKDFELFKDNFYKKLSNDFSGKLTIEKGQVVEKEEEKEILDELEKEYLRAVIKPFRKKVVGIKKIESIICHYKECISISVLDENNIYLPYFKKDTMYKGMEERKFYTIEELGL